MRKARIVVEAEFLRDLGQIWSNKAGLMKRCIKKGEI